ncbi:MAG: type III pantothenate kinase [Oscillospiraceae bacterium]|nr:type III pantothenate kinase [Oscillospiraceae bacterium]
MLLTIDVGNTNMVFGLFDEDGKIKAKFRLSTEIARTADEIGLTISQFCTHFGFDLKIIKDVAVCSVVPQMMYTLRHAADKYLGLVPLIAGETLDIPLVNLCSEPLGVDRAVTLVGAREKYGNQCIVVDFGTATKIDALNTAGEYVGGVICPGVMLSMEALFVKAAKLPRIELKKPPRAIGTDTVGQMQAGAVYGFVGSTEYIIRLFKREMGADDIRTIATGGLARLISEHTDEIRQVDPNLTLTGLWECYRKGGSL